MLKAFIKDTAIYGLSDFVLKLLAFATFPIFTYTLSVAEFGVFSLVTTLSALAATVFTCGLGNAVQRYAMDPEISIAERPQIISTGLWSLLLIAVLVCSSVLWAAHVWQIEMFDRHQITWAMVVWGLLGCVGLQVNSFCMDVIRLHFQPWTFALLSFLQNGLLITLSLWFVCKMHWGVVGYVAATAIAYLIITPLCFWLIRSDLTFHFDSKRAAQMLRFGYPFIFAGLGYWMFSSMDRWMLGDLSSNVEVGLYSVAFKVSSVLIMLNLAFGQAWSPHALLAYNVDPSYRSFYSRLLTLWFFTLIILCSLVIFFSPELFMLLTPPDFWPAASLVSYIGISIVFSGTNQILTIGISLAKKTHHLSIAAWLAAILNFSLNFALIPAYGAHGAAIATLCSTLFLWSYYLVCSQKLHPIPLEKQKLAVCCLLTAIALCTSLWLNTQTWSTTILAYKIAILSAIITIGLFAKLIDVNIIQAQLKASSA